MVRAHFGRWMRREGIDIEDAQQEVYCGLLARQDGPGAFDPARASWGKYVYIVARGVLANLVDKRHRQDRRDLAFMAEVPVVEQERGAEVVTFTPHPEEDLVHAVDERRGRMGLRALGNWVVVGMLDYDTHTEVTPDGTRVEYHVDPKTGLAMAATITPHVGIIMEAGPESGWHGARGSQVVLQRDHGREFDWEGARVRAVATEVPCDGCKTPMRAHPFAAVKVDGRWLAPDGRVLLEPDAAESGHAVVLAYGAGPTVRVGERVTYEASATGTVAWSEGGRSYLSMLWDRTCRWCGRCARGGVLAVVEGYQPRESAIVRV